jgi:DNA mismatch repair protein MutL
MKSQIRLLDQSVIHRIAAGEVVENPASVIKELVENSLDAGATHINVKLISAGFELIEVQDNGFGMSREDLEVCCQRHATSKISSLDDLDQISSLGFRGEALAALSAISQLEILSREKDSLDTWLLKRIGSEYSTVPATRNVGTTLRVHQLFFNTPARLKFMKSQNSEASKCIRVFLEMALAHPDRSMSLYLMSSSGEINEEYVFGASDRAQRVSDILKKNKDDFFQAQADVFPNGLKKLELIFLKAPQYARNSRDIYFVVNGRCIEDKRLAYVLREAFGSLIEVGHYPRGVVYLDVDLSVVDINVHPQKKEVRWSQDFPLYSLIYEAIKRALHPHSSTNEKEKNDSSNLSLFSSLTNHRPELNPPISAQNLTIQNDLSFSSVVSSSEIQKESSSTFFSSLRVVGEVGAAWLLCESPEGLVVIDQHAAHERVRFHEFMQKDLFPSTALLLPLQVKIPLAARGKEQKILQALENFGFEGLCNSQNDLEFFSEPKTERKVDWKHVFDEVFERSQGSENLEALLHQLKVWIASSLACHGSVRRGQRLTNDEIKALLAQLDQVDWKEFCPHGRPTWISLSHVKLEEEFHRS